MNYLKSIAIVFGVTFFVACNTDELENRIADLEQENHELKGGNNNKEEQIEDYIHSLNEIYDNLAVIKEKEGMITANIDMSSGEIQGGMKDKIVDDIKLINDLLNENKNKMAAINSRLNQSNLKVAELEKLINNLQTQIADKDVEIVTLQSMLANANEQIKVLFEEYNMRLEELGEQTEKLNTAFYCYGTSKELKENGVVSKKGGFIGIGKTSKLSQDFNEEYFTKIDITLTGAIDLKAKKAKLITNHPSSSYELKGEDGAVDKLVILDAESFWSASKYLVIEVQN